MADKETGLNITVGAVADENSAVKAAKDLTKAVDSSVKGGRITVPVDISVPIDESKEKLTKAQKAVIDTLTKMTSKGFSASGKDIDDLTSKFNEFTHALDEAGKGRQNKIFREIRKQVEEVKQTYKAVQVDKKSTRTHDTKTNKSKASKKDKSYIDTGAKVSKREIDAAIKAEQKRRYRGTKSTGPAGFGSGWVDPSRTNERDAKLSELSSYPSGMARQIRQSERESKGWMRDSLVITKDKELADKMANDAIARGRRKQPTAIEKAGQLSDDLRKNLLPNLLSKMKISETDDELSKLSEKFFDTLETISKLNQDAGKLIFDDVKKNIGIVMGNLGFTSSGNIGGTDDGKEDGSRNPKVLPALKGLLDKVAEKEDEIKQELIKLEQSQKTSSSKTKIEKTVDNFANRIIAETRTSKTTQVQNSDNIVQAMNKNQAAIETNTSYDKIENSAERVADTASGKKTDSLIKNAEADLGSGFNTDSKANELIDAIRNLGSILNSVFVEVQSITKNGVNITGLRKGQTNTKTDHSLLPVPAQPKMQQALAMTNYVIKYGKSQAVSGDIPSSMISTTVKDPHSWVTKLRDAFAELTNTTANYKVIMAKTSKEQDDMLADRIRKYGISRGNGPTDTGDKTMIARRLSLFRNKDYFKTLFKDINLSEGIKIDTTDVTDKLAKALSGREMFNAQTGGWLKNILGAMTGGLAFAFQPSLEKSRSRAEGVNQIMANIRKALNDTLQDIQDKESKLRGMKASGDLKLDAKGNVLESSSTEAKTLVLQLQESKDALNSILADTKYVDEVVSRTHGRIGGMIKQLGFTSPVLRKNNAILANLNTGLDKGGKALKYQTRLAELLSYTFRLISRHAGQTFKNLLLQLNPLTHIKKAFQDFMGYNIKWQRTMNVIKYNLRAILQPFMDKVAQFLVNCIGFIDIISMKVQKAFGNVPVSLFDQAAADTEKMKEELEAAANVTAGFDELHDIGSDNSGANDLFGDIYKPQLSQEWIDLANEIGDLFAGLIKGDLGFGEVMAKIFDILLKGLGAIAGAIWDWFKQTSFGKWITENWQHLLWTLLNIFIAWKLFKILGPMLLRAFTGWATEGVFKGLLSKIGGWIIGGFKSLFASGGMIGTITSGATSLGTIFGQALLAVTGGIIAGTGGKIAADMISDDTDYNYGLMSAGGKEQDKKSSTGAYATSAITGAIGGGITGFAIGGPVGAAIGATLGAIANIVNTSLVPGFREWSIKIKDATNELQSLSYYEGRLQAATSEVNQYTEMVNLFTGSIKTQTDSIYKQGEQLGITKSRMDFLIESVQNGTFYTGMLSGSEEQLAGSLGRLATMTEKTEEASNKLTEAKKKQAKAETTLAIAQDMSAGNLELAAARVEVAYASEVYTVDEATKQMSQIIKKGSDEQKLAMLEDMSPDIQANFKKYATATEEGVNDICEIFYNMNEEAQKAFAKDYAEEAKSAMQRTLQALQQTIDNSNIFDGMKSSIARIQKELIIKNAKAQGIDLAYLDVGTNYVPNDGLAYLHQGEAVIPKKYNQPYQPQDTSAMSNAIDRLVQQVANISSKVDQGIAVKGQFVQKGSDLVATVEKANNRMKNNVLNNKVYAR